MTNNFSTWIISGIHSFLWRIIPKPQCVLHPISTSCASNPRKTFQMDCKPHVKSNWDIRPIPKFSLQLNNKINDYTWGHANYLIFMCRSRGVEDRGSSAAWRKSWCALVAYGRKFAPSGPKEFSYSRPMSAFSLLSFVVHRKSTIIESQTLNIGIIVFNSYNLQETRT